MVYEIVYTYDRNTYSRARVVADTLAKALLKFTLEHPKAEYFDYKEIIKENEDNL